jgi:signal transduction histidine kinase
MIAFLSHEVRNPQSAILMSVDALLEQARAAISVSNSSANAFIALPSSFPAVTRPQVASSLQHSNSGHFTSEHVRMLEIIRSSAESVTVLLEGSHSLITFLWLLGLWTDSINVLV